MRLIVETMKMTEKEKETVTDWLLEVNEIKKLNTFKKEEEN